MDRCTFKLWLSPAFSPFILRLTDPADTQSRIWRKKMVVYMELFSLCETMMLGFFGSNDRPVVHMFDPKKSWQVAVP